MKFFKKLWSSWYLDSLISHSHNFFLTLLLCGRKDFFQIQQWGSIYQEVLTHASKLHYVSYAFVIAISLTEILNLQTHFNIERDVIPLLWLKSLVIGIWTCVWFYWIYHERKVSKIYMLGISVREVVEV